MQATRAILGCVLVNTSFRPFSPFFHRLRPRNYAALLGLALHPGAGHGLPMDAPDWVLEQMQNWLLWVETAKVGRALLDETAPHIEKTRLSNHAPCGKI